MTKSAWRHCGQVCGGFWRNPRFSTPAATPGAWKRPTGKCGGDGAKNGNDMKKGITVTAELQKALGHHQAGNLKEAEKIYRRVLKAQPGNPDALHLSGLVHHQFGRHKKAMGLIRRAVKAVPGNPMFLNNLGEACREAGKL
ncbi:MAG TPA: tetratricopeptide repeat protein, partial [Alphaproteobacteria bacterium]|nr:tetratricopeptide repeat protein [Alphaproteobacteria bacterium]